MKCVKLKLVMFALSNVIFVYCDWKSFSCFE